jgi:hypothetical protein
LQIYSAASEFAACAIEDLESISRQNPQPRRDDYTLRKFAIRNRYGYQHLN